MNKKTSWNPQTYATNARFVSDLGEPLLQLLQPQSGELILDLGCGDGALTKKIAACDCDVVGVDSSFPQLQAAKERGLKTVLLGGHHLCFQQRFDAVFTNAALHWLKEPERVIDGVWLALKSRGRFIGEFGGKGNVETIRCALHAALVRRGIDAVPVDPWYYPSPREYSQLLSKAGFTVAYIELIPRPTKLPGDIRAWLEIFAQPFTKAVCESDRVGFLEEIRRELATNLRDSAGNWFADYIRLRFRATKE
jgi:trans-aconitate methyltransferase